MQIWKEQSGIDMACHTIPVTPQRKNLVHWHENFEFCQPLDNACDFLVNGITVHAQAGDIVAIAPQVIHRFLPCTEFVNVRVVQFPVRLLLPAAEYGFTLQTHITREELGNIPGLIQAVQALLELMEQEPHTAVGQRNMLLQSLSTTLFYLLQRHFPAKEPARFGKDADLFLATVQYVNDHFTEDDLTVQKIAKQLSVTREKLSIVFTRYAGLSLKQYVNTLRVDRVNQLLMEGWSVARAGLESGFNSIRTFGYAYHSVMGMSPTEYLRTRM